MAQTAPEVNLVHRGHSMQQDVPIDPLAKFERVLKVLAGLDPFSTNPLTVSHTRHPIYRLIKKKAIRFKNEG